MALPIKATASAMKRVPFLVWLWIVQLFLLIQAPAIAPPGQVETFRTMLIIYMLGQVMFFSLAPQIKGLKATPNIGLPMFVIGFVVAVTVISGLQWIRGFGMQTYSVSAASYLIITHTVIVGVSETLLFQGFLAKLITPLPAQVLFGVFHYTAYGGDVFSIFIAIGAGLVFYVIASRVSIYAAAGCHSGYNVAVLQILGVIRWF